MCIIVVCEDKKPTLEFLQQCERENPHGGGIAWREHGKIRWIKAIKASEIYKISQEVPLPYVIHFRIASSGSISPDLCHPFPIGGQLEVKGIIEKGVLFHNGTWREWQALLYKTFPKPIPNGEWNDSRTMAYIASMWGTNWLRMPASAGNRICVFTPKKIHMFGDWVKEQGFRLSHTMRYAFDSHDVTTMPYNYKSNNSVNTTYIPGRTATTAAIQRLLPSVCDTRVASAEEEPLGPPPDELDEYAPEVIEDINEAHEEAMQWIAEHNPAAISDEN